MKLSRKSDYALRALVHLTLNRNRGPISIRELAVENDVPKRFLEQIMLEMKGKGWVASTAGRIGGFKLAKSPDDITMGQVVRHFDGVLAPVWCVSVTEYEPCSQEPKCRFRRVLLDARNYVSRLMDQTTLSKVVLESVVTIEEVFNDNYDGAGI
jgi:Rrf2 family protein